MAGLDFDPNAVARKVAAPQAQGAPIPVPQPPAPVQAAVAAANLRSPPAPRPPSVISPGADQAVVQGAQAADAGARAVTAAGGQAARMMGGAAQSAAQAAGQFVDQQRQSIQQTGAATAAAQAEARQAAGFFNPAAPTDPDTNHPRNDAKTGAGGVLPSLGDIGTAALKAIFPNDYMRQETPSGGVKPAAQDPFAYRQLPAQPSPVQPAPVASASPAAAAPVQPTPAAPPPAAIAAPAQPQRTQIGAVGSTPIYADQIQTQGMPVPGATQGAIGVEGLQRQLANIQALNASTPTGYSAAMPDSRVDESNARLDAARQGLAFQNALSGVSRGRAAKILNERMTADQHDATLRAGQEVTAQGQQLGYASHLQGIGLQGQNAAQVAQANNLAHLQGIGLQGRNAAQVAQANNLAHLQGITLQTDANRYATDVGAKTAQNKLISDSLLHSADTAAANERARLGAQSHVQAATIAAGAPHYIYNPLGTEVLEQKSGRITEIPRKKKTE